MDGKNVDLLVWISSNRTLSDLYQLKHNDDVNTIIDLAIQRIKIKYLNKYILPLCIILGYTIGNNIPLQSLQLNVQVANKFESLENKGNLLAYFCMVPRNNCLFNVMNTAINNFITEVQVCRSRNISDLIFSWEISSQILTNINVLAECYNMNAMISKLKNMNSYVCKKKNIYIYIYIIKIFRRCRVRLGYQVVIEIISGWVIYVDGIMVVFGPFVPNVCFFL